MCKSWCEPFSLGAHHYFDFKGHGSWVEFLSASCFVFVCLFVFQLPRWVIILILSLTSGRGFLILCVCVGGVCVGVWVWGCVCFMCVLCCFSFKMFNFPTIYLGSGWFFFSPIGKVFCFLLFLFVCFYLILFCFVLFCFQKFPPPWYQMVRPYSYSITQMMVDITSSTILNSRAIQWKIWFQSETSLIHSFKNVK